MVEFDWVWVGGYGRYVQFLTRAVTGRPYPKFDHGHKRATCIFSGSQYIDQSADSVRGPNYLKYHVWYEMGTVRIPLFTIYFQEYYINYSLHQKIKKK